MSLMCLPGLLFLCPVHVTTQYITVIRGVAKLECPDRDNKSRTILVRRAVGWSGGGEKGGGTAPDASCRAHKCHQVGYISGGRLFVSSANRLLQCSQHNSHTLPGMSKQRPTILNQSLGLILILKSTIYNKHTTCFNIMKTVQCVIIWSL
jgi:hypothetical protein